MKLYYRTVGEAGIPIIILHGLFGSSDNWLTISKTIADQGYRVILPDQRNHGRSPRSNDFDYQSMAADLKELIDDLELDQPILVGHSMGGKTVMQYAMNFRNDGTPGKFSHLVVVDIAPKFYPVHHSDILKGLNAINLASLKSRNEADAVLSSHEPSVGVRQFLLKNLYRNEQGQFDWRINLPVIERKIHGIGEELTNPRIVTEPTLFIRGSESSYVLDDDIPAIRRIFPNARIATIAGAGHWVQAEKPDAFVEELFNFLA
ncbi:alpha/beta fold hydrolase [Nibrella viscosa]|uniref:Alpha/beta fold hydrolase n=1 Tax=Nibrella viscosa TaxID=1084524 RepID=A0ABP8K825_9BACT